MPGMGLAFRFIKPRKSFRQLADKVARQLNTLERDAEGIKADFEATTATWKHKPEFVIKFQPWPTAGAISAVVYTDDEIYGYVDRGTKPHPIAAKYAPYLRFQVGYHAKTTPNTIGSHGGGKFGPWRMPKEVQHPGTEARNFSQIIQEKWQKRLPEDMQEAVRRGVMEW